jgi:hypothetical protein
MRFSFPLDKNVFGQSLSRMKVKSSLLRNWRRALARPFLEASTQGFGAKIVHCKSSFCKAVIRVEGSTSVKCGECSFAFCSACDYPAPHAPATCNMITAWQEKDGMVEASEEDMRNYLAIKKVQVRTNIAVFIITILIVFLVI